MKSSDLFTVKILHIEIQVALAPLLYLCAGGLQFGSWQGPDAFGYPVEDFEKWIYYIMLFTDLVLLNKTVRVDMDGIVIARCFGMLKRRYRFDDFNYGYVECEDDETLSVYLVKQPVYRDKNSRELVVRKPFVWFPPYYSLYQILKMLKKGLVWNQFPPEALPEESKPAARTIRENRMIYNLIHIAILSCYVAISLFTLLSERFLYLNAALIFGLMFLYMRVLPGRLDALEEEYFLLCRKRLKATPHNA